MKLKESSEQEWSYGNLDIVQYSDHVGDYDFNLQCGKRK